MKAAATNISTGFPAETIAKPGTMTLAEAGIIKAILCPPQVGFVGTPHTEGKPHLLSLIHI